jgi:hypothetical protein
MSYPRRNILIFCVLLSVVLVLLWIGSNHQYLWVGNVAALVYWLLAAWFLIRKQSKAVVLCIGASILVSFYIKELIVPKASIYVSSIAHFDNNNIYQYAPEQLADYPYEALNFHRGVDSTTIQVLTPYLSVRFPYYQIRLDKGHQWAFFSRKAFVGCDTLQCQPLEQ